MQVITAPTVEPVSLDEVKQQLNMVADEVQDDVFLSRLIIVARQAAEAITRRAIAEQTIEVSMEAPWNPVAVLELPRPVLRSVVSITVDGSVLVEGSYSVRTDSLVGTVRPVEMWPEGQLMTVRFVAGWTPGETPETIKQWMLVKVADLYAQRESFRQDQGRMSVAAMPRSFIDALLDEYVVPEVI